VSGFAGKDCGPSRSGYPTFARLHSRPKRIGNLARLQRAPMPRRTRSSSTRPPIGVAIETRRNLDGRFDTDSVTICAFTTAPTDAPLLRLPVEPNERNGLRSLCRMMVDKIYTVPKTKIGGHVGRLDDEDILRLNRAVFVFLGLAGTPANG
jgi:mRNA interferase MazF